MNVNLGTAFDKFIAELLKTGLYQSQSEVVREGLRLLKEREELKTLRLAELRKEIAIGGGDGVISRFRKPPLTSAQKFARRIFGVKGCRAIGGKLAAMYAWITA